MGGSATPDNRSWDAPPCPDCESEVFVDGADAPMFTHTCRFCGLQWDESDRPDTASDPYMAVPADDAHLPEDEPPTENAIVSHVASALEALWDGDDDRFERELEIAVGQNRKRRREGGDDDV